MVRCRSCRIPFGDMLGYRTSHFRNRLFIWCDLALAGLTVVQVVGMVVRIEGMMLSNGKNSKSGCQCDRNERNSGSNSNESSSSNGNRVVGIAVRVVYMGIRIVGMIVKASQYHRFKYAMLILCPKSCVNAMSVKQICTYEL